MTPCQLLSYPTTSLRLLYENSETTLLRLKERRGHIHWTSSGLAFTRPRLPVRPRGGEGRRKGFEKMTDEEAEEEVVEEEEEKEEREVEDQKEEKDDQETTGEKGGRKAMKC